MRFRKTSAMEPKALLKMSAVTVPEESSNEDVVATSNWAMRMFSPRHSSWARSECRYRQSFHREKNGSVRTSPKSAVKPLGKIFFDGLKKNGWKSLDIQVTGREDTSGKSSRLSSS